MSEKDLPEAADFIAAQSGREAPAVTTHLRWFLLQNPARRPDDALGYGLRSLAPDDNGKLVGCILLSPQWFQYRREKILFLGSSSFYVDERYRGHGGRIFLQYCRMARTIPLFGTSANAEAAALWKAAGASPIPFSDGELFGVLNWPPVAKEFVHRRYSNHAFTRVAGSGMSKLIAMLRPLRLERQAGDLRQLGLAQDVLDLFPTDLSLNRLASSNRLTALRDLPYIRWRYFSGQDASTAAFAYRNENTDKEILVTVNQRPRGYRGQIKTLNVLDVYPEVKAAEWMRIVSSLIAHYKGIVDAVVLRSVNGDLWQEFRKGGFQPRKFDAPNGWFLDKRKLVQANDWYAVPADGDGLI